jgi:hypothetical protein
MSGHDRVGHHRTGHRLVPGQPHTRRKQSSVPLSVLEEKMCNYLKTTNEWALKNSVLDIMAHSNPRLTTKSRILVNMFNQNQYKILNTCAMFLSPFVIKHVKKVTWVKYKPHVDDHEGIGNFRKNLIPLFTSFALWEYLIDRPYQTSTASITHLHELFPQWSIEDWTTVIEKLNSFFKQINNPQSIRVEMKRIDSATLSAPSSSHYPWWKYEKEINTIHEEMRERLYHVNHPVQQQLLSTRQQSNQQSNLDSHNPSNLLYLNCDHKLLDTTFASELVNLSKNFYEYFRQQISFAEIQHIILQCRFDHDEIKRQLERELEKHAKNDESFPEHLEQLRSCFKHKQLSTQQLFNLWKQSHGNWSILNMILN